MIYLFLLIIIIIISIYIKAGGRGDYIIIKSDAVNLYNFFNKIIPKYYAHKNLISNAYFNNNAKLDFYKYLIFYKSEAQKKYMMGSPEIAKIFKMQDEIKKLNRNHNYTKYENIKIKKIKNNIYKAPYIGKFVCSEKRFASRLYYYKPTIKEMLAVALKYKVLDRFLQAGNQYSTFLPGEMIALRNEYNIEVFGSAFNTNLQYYGCLFPELEKPFGAIGNYEEVLQGILDNTLNIEIRGVYISPPSSKEIHKKAAQYTIKILKARKIKIILTLSRMKTASYNIVDGFPELRKYEIKRVPRNYAYDYSRGAPVLLRSPWIDIYYSSI